MGKKYLPVKINDNNEKNLSWVDILNTVCPELGHGALY